MLRYFAFLLMFVIINSCRSQNKENWLPVNFQETTHFPLKFTDADYQWINTQQEMENIYKAINKANPSPRKIPIPTMEPGVRYLLLQPQKEKGDYEIAQVLTDEKDIKIVLKPASVNNYPADAEILSVLELRELRSQKQVKLIFDK